MTCAQFCEVFAEMYPPSFLFSPNLMTMPSIFASLRDFLNSKGAKLTQHSTQRVIMTIASSVYDESEDREAALENAENLFSERRCSLRSRTSASAGGEDSSTGTTISSPASAASREDRRTHNIRMRFKEKDYKFSGDTGQSWIEYVS